MKTGSYFFEQTSLSHGFYALLDAAAQSEKLDISHRDAFQSVLYALDLENLETPKLIYHRICDALIQKKQPIKENSQIAKMIRVLSVKVGASLVSTEHFNQKLSS